ncbi:site-2 protease family protein [Kiloniella sp. EL199]|uniref:site-2 protease family protein n=1 Tax=Kiloniella sp. EL199 TaxID=2107581 RepID=UPI000EA1922C|nr:site-2 protease family protein [Kiloniella sp. EL199]
MDINEFLLGASVWVLPVLLAVTLHEAAHAYAARLLGDDTASKLGRVSLNPAKHIDPFGTILLPSMLILIGSPFILGWAKPVPVVFGRLNNPKRDMIFVALAGPVSNIFIALIAALGFAVFGLVPDFAADWVGQNLENAIKINLMLAVFNMLPIPPLDGGRVVTGLLPTSLAIPFSRLEKYGMIILIGLIFVLPMIGRQIGMDLNLISYVIIKSIHAMLPFFQAIANLNII